MIFHLVSKSEWDVLLPARPYIPSTYIKDGFIHCSADEGSMLAVANRFYKGLPGEVLLLAINETKLTAPVKWEAPVHPTPAVDKTVVIPPEVIADMGTTAGETISLPNTAPIFPHIYGPLNREAIVAIRVFTRAADGSYTGSQALPTPSASVPIAPPTPLGVPAPVGVPTPLGVPAPSVSTAPSTPTDPSNPLNLKPPSQMAQELLDATDGFSDALKRYKDRVESHIEDLDKNIKKSLGED